jgi:hypothetical protein
MYFNINSVVLFIIGVAFLLFAKLITKPILQKLPKGRFESALSRKLLFLWPTRAIGIMCIVFGFVIAMSGPANTSLKKGSNRLLLLERGTLAPANVRKVFRQSVAPAGWKVIYEFDAKEPVIGELKTYIGSAQGPMKYYVPLSNGAKIAVIYDPCNPKLNCEIRCFLNKPSFRNTFRKAGKLNLLERFRNTYRIEDYTFEEWYRQQQQK